MKKIKQKTKKSNSKKIKEILLSNVDKIDKSFNINFKDRSKVNDFINGYTNGSDIVMLISNVTNVHESIFYFTNSWNNIKFNLAEVNDFVFESNFDDIEELIINLQEEADVMVLDQLFRIRFKSELPFAGMKVIFVNTYLDDYFSEKGNDKIKLINIEV